MADQPLVAEHELLSAGPNGEPAPLDVADVGVRQPHVELIAEWRAGDRAVSSLDARVLRLHRCGQPRLIENLAVTRKRFSQ